MNKIKRTTPGVSPAARGRLVGKVLAALTVIAALLSWTAVAASAAGSPVVPSADSYVQSDNPLGNYGSRTFVRADSTPWRVSYLKFDVVGVGPQPSATLRLFVESSGDGLELFEVTDNSWDELTINFNNAPLVGQSLGFIGPVKSGTNYNFDISSVYTGDGTYSFAVMTPDTTSIKITSREGLNPPLLFAPTPPPATHFVVSYNGVDYTATSQTTPETYVGALKAVVESAATSLSSTGGGAVQFNAGVYDLGSDFIKLENIDNVDFYGAGIGVTTIMNNSSLAGDTEVWNTVDVDGSSFREMSVSADGPPRTTSDALDFDNGNNILVENIEVLKARGRGIVFDGKGIGWSSENNEIRGCKIYNVPSDGIELLAASNNLVQDCEVVGSGGHGIQITKASTQAKTPNKQANDNTVIGNTITGHGRDGVNINSSNGNQIVDNTIMNNSQVSSGRDGIRIESFNGIVCNGNLIEGNTATDDQQPKTQRWGLNISKPECDSNIVRTNNFAGNLTGEIKDNGTNTIYDLPADTSPPTVPGNVNATALSHYQVDVTWDASSDDVGVDSYTIYRDSNFLATVDGTTLSYLDETAASSTSYNYTVEAFDAAGNGSGQSAPAPVTTPADSGSLTFSVTDDAYVNGNNPGGNYGSSSNLRVDGSPELNSYLKFDVQGVGTVTQATLRVWAETGSSNGIAAHAVGDTSWLETNITFGNAPGLGAELDSTTSVSSGGYIEFDVTSHVTTNGLVSLGLSTPGSRAIRLTSDEGSSNRPELVVSYN